MMSFKEFWEEKRMNKEKAWRKGIIRKEELDKELDVYGFENYERVCRKEVDHPSDSSLRALHTIKGASHMYCPEIAYSFCMGWKRQNRYHNRELMHRYRKKIRMPVKEGQYDIKPLLRN